MKFDNVIVDKSKAFAIRIIKMYQYLIREKKEYILSKQIIRSGTSIGANVKEASHAYSKPDFYTKIGIALKEASETEYWLELLHATGYLTNMQFDSMCTDCQEVLKILMAISRTNKK
ncbi:MAG: four helix bundle protein [Victivallales bacterium]|nr:four helix bundle protein [Victivallales bacterium]